MVTNKTTHELPVIALKNVVLFPRIAMPLVVQRDKSLSAIDEAMSRDRLVIFVGQKNPSDNVEVDEMFSVGTVGKVFEVHKMPDGTSRVDVEGIARVRIGEFIQTEPFFKAIAEDFKTTGIKSIEIEAIMRTVSDQL